jgi:hypothetical protein
VSLREPVLDHEVTIEDIALLAKSSFKGLNEMELGVS